MLVMQTLSKIVVFFTLHATGAGVPNASQQALGLLTQSIFSMPFASRYFSTLPLIIAFRYDDLLLVVLQHDRKFSSVVIHCGQSLLTLVHRCETPTCSSLIVWVVTYQAQ